MLVVSVGTGAVVDDLDRLQQYQFNDPIINRSRVPTFDTTPTRTPAEDLARIREVFPPAVSDLAKSFSVSRQTVYNWLNGERPKSEQIAKLRDLAYAAELIAGAGIPITGALLKRKVIGGKNLFEIAHDGGSARDVAQLLVQIVRREIEQRERMAARFADRKTALRSAESDFPAENDAS